MWRPVVGYHGIYEVSDEGQVRSIDRLLPDGRKCRGRLLKSGTNRAGYHHVVLSKGGRTRTRLVHLLVADAFLGDRQDGFTVAHGENGKSDNSILNLSIKHRRVNSGEDRNRDHTYKSPLVGVFPIGKRFRSSIKIEGKTKHLGTFDTPNEAHVAYLKARKELI